MAEETVRAIVLRRAESGDSDRRLTLFTRERGKIAVVAKGARKGGSRLAGVSEPLMAATFGIALGRQRRFVTQVQPETSFPGIRSDYDRLLAGLAICEVLDELLPWETVAPEVYDLAIAGLRHLESAETWQAALAWLYVQTLALEGHGPSWSACAVTGQRVAENPAFFSGRAGGHVSRAEAGPYGDRFEAPAEALIALDKLGDLNEPPSRLKFATECLEVLVAYLRSVLDSDLPANRSLLDALRSQA